MSRFKLQSDREHERAIKKKARDELPPIPANATWMLVFGLDGDVNCKHNAHRFEAAIAGTGKPFVLAGPDIVYDAGDIPVIIAFGGQDIAKFWLKETKAKTATVPLVIVRSNASGYGVTSQGMHDAERIHELFERARELQREAMS